MSNYPHSKFSEEVFDKICNELAQSNRGLKHICLDNGISSVAFYSWIQKDETLLNKYTRAREQQADFLADEIIEIADDSTGDKKTIEKNGKLIELEDTEFTSRSKLRVEARKWIAAKLKPKKYGDKIDVTTNGEKISQNPVVDLSKLDTETLNKLLGENPKSE